MHWSSQLMGEVRWSPGTLSTDVVRFRACALMFVRGGGNPCFSVGVGGGVGARKVNDRGH